MTSSELYKHLKDKNISLIMIDARRTDDFEKSHIQDSRCINVPANIIRPG